jgi:hypothetical protein
MPSRTLVGWSARAGMLGGLLWALFPLLTVVVSLDEARFGTPSYVAVAALYWLMAVVPLLLLLFALAGLRAAFGGAYGRLGNTGFLVSFVALVFMFVGNGVEVASLTLSGSESSLGHSLFLIGFLVLLLGSVFLGVALVKARRDAVSCLAGLLLALALPLGILLALVLGSIAPETDLGFWAAITVPYGVAWTLLGYSLASRHAEPAGQPARVA